MERLGFSPARCTYSLIHSNICKCDNNCKIIVFARGKQMANATRDGVRRAIPASGPFNKHDSTSCSRCGSPILYRSKLVHCPKGLEDNFSYHRCVECQLIINRMYEYWEDRHPLFKDLSPDDYLKTEVREPIIVAKCNELRKQLYTEISALGNFLPKDLYREIIKFQLEIIYRDFRLSAVVLSASDQV